MIFLFKELWSLTNRFDRSNYIYIVSSQLYDDIHHLLLYIVLPMILLSFIFMMYLVFEWMESVEIFYHLFIYNACIAVGDLVIKSGGL